MVLSNSEAEPLTRSQIADLWLASSNLTGAKRRSFQAEMCLKYVMEVQDGLKQYWVGIEPRLP